MKFLGFIPRRREKKVTIPIDDETTAYIHNLESEYIEKSTNKKREGQAKAYVEPVLTNVSMNPDYREAPSINGTHNLLNILKYWSRRNIILNAIINTRINQVSLFCNPSRYSDTGVGYEVRLKDPQAKPTTHDKANFLKIEEFLEHTGKVKDDFTRDNFTSFVKKLVRDRLVYDKINFEMLYDSKGKMHSFNAVDASTIYLAVDKEGRIPKDKKGVMYVQMMDEVKVAEFTAKELAWEVHNPRTDVYAGAYGYPELEIAMHHLRYHENTEVFNERYFSQGGTTRGLLHIRTGQEQSQSALSSFRREWTSMFSGVNGAWKIPVITAEDVKFVNMNQSARDMEFEKWLNYLINVICSIFQIDPSEINFPNRGGATGSSGNTLNESGGQDKMRNSKDKGLEPLLKFIEDTINKYIISQYGGKYVFNFVGGDSESELEIIEILAAKAKIGYTLNDVREELGKKPIPGGDVVLAGVHVQRLGQLLQMEETEKEEKRELNEFIAHQTGYNGDMDNVNGKDTYNQQVGKDGQMKDKPNMNAGPNKDWEM